MAQIATFRYVIGSTLQDADTVTLSNQPDAPDPAASWGLKQLGPGTIKAAAGTATVRASLGTYTYDYGALGLDPTLRYVISFKAVKSGQPDQYGVATIAASPQTATLRNLRHRLAAYLGGWDGAQVGVQDEPPLGNYAGTSADRRRVASSDLAVTDRSGALAGAANDAYDGAWLYVPSRQMQRQIVVNGYESSLSAAATLTGTASTEKVGELVLGRVLDTALAAGTDVELHRVLPVLDAPRFPGLHHFINRALEALPLRDRVALPAAGTYRSSLAAHPWLTDERRVTGVTGPEIVTGITGLRLDFDVRLEAEIPYLETGIAYDAPDSLSLDVTRPRSSWIRVGGVWGDSNAGLVNESDEATGDPHFIMLSAAYFALDFLANDDPRGLVPSAMARRDRLARIVGPSLLLEAGAARVPRPPLGRSIWGSPWSGWR